MECAACGRELAEAVYSVDDESQRYPLCQKCDEVVDVRLLLLEQVAQESMV